MFTIDRIDTRNGKHWPRRYKAKADFNFNNDGDRNDVNDWRRSVYELSFGKSPVHDFVGRWTIPEEEHLTQILRDVVNSGKANKIPWDEIVASQNAHFEGKVIAKGTPYASTGTASSSSSTADFVQEDYLYNPRTRQACRARSIAVIGAKKNKQSLNAEVMKDDCESKSSTGDDKTKAPT